MKWKKREPYKVIADVSDLGLCNFCKYGDFEGSWCEANLYCGHPLEIINDTEKCHEVWQGNDCWGFRPRPKYNLQTCGVIASIAAEGLLPYFGHGEWVGVVPREKIPIRKVVV